MELFFIIGKNSELFIKIKNVYIKTSFNIFSRIN